MYQTSNEYKVAIKRSVIQYNIRGTVNGIPITKDNVLKNSLYITNKCASKNRVEIGSVYVGELNVVLLMDLDPYSLRGKEISFDCGVKVGNDYEWIPRGKFIIDDATKTALETSIKEVRDVIAKEDSTTEEIKAKTEALTQAAMKLGELMYKQQQTAGAQAGTEAGAEAKTENGEKVVDAEF